MFERKIKNNKTKPFDVDISNIEEYDEEKLNFVYQLFLQRLEEDRSITKSLKTRATFFLSILGVILTIIVSIIGSEIIEIVKWAYEAQIMLISLVLVFATAITLYFYLYFKLQTSESLVSILPDNIIQKLITDNIDSKKECLILRISCIYKNITLISKINKKSDFWFMLADLVFFVGITGVAMVSGLYILYNAPITFPILFLYLIFASYGVCFIVVILHYKEFIADMKYAGLRIGKLISVGWKKLQGKYQQYKLKKQTKDTIKNKD